MRQVRAHRFGWYMMVSVLIHLVGASWVFRQSSPIALSPDPDIGIRVRVVTSAGGLTSAATAQSAPLPVSHLASIAPVQPTPAEPAMPPATRASQVPLPSPVTMGGKVPQPSPVRQVRKTLPPRKRPTPRPMTKATAAKPPPQAKRQPKPQPPEPPLTTASLDPSTPAAEPLRREFADRPSQADPTPAGDQNPPSRVSRASRDGATGGGAPRFVFQPKPKYPMIARRRGWEGTVVLNLEVLADGSIGAVEVIHSSGYRQLDKTAKTTVKRWKHRPLAQRSQRAKKWATQEIHFKLN